MVVTRSDGHVGDEQGSCVPAVPVFVAGEIRPPQPRDRPVVVPQEGADDRVDQICGGHVRPIRRSAAQVLRGQSGEEREAVDVGDGRGEDVEGDQEGAHEDGEDGEDVAQHADESQEDGAIGPGLGHRLGLRRPEDGGQPAEWSLGERQGCRPSARTTRSRFVDIPTTRPDEAESQHYGDRCRAVEHKGGQERGGGDLHHAVSTRRIDSTAARFPPGSRMGKRSGPRIDLPCCCQS